MQKTLSGNILFAVILLLSACEMKRSSNHLETHSGVVGGRKVTPEESFQRFIAGVIRKLPGDKSLICTGTFITQNILLTAAHCLPSTHLPDLVKVQRQTEVSTFGPMLEVDSYVRHEGYTGVGENDLALVKLKLRQEDVVPAVFLVNMTPTHMSWRFTALGYGKDSTLRVVQKGSVKNELRTVELSALSYFPDSSHFKARMTDKKAVCFGDSGGPALLYQQNQWLILGVLSYVEDEDSQGSNECDLASYYSSTEFHRPWLYKAIKRLDPNIILP